MRTHTVVRRSLLQRCCSEGALVLQNRYEDTYIVAYIWYVDTYSGKRGEPVAALLQRGRVGWCFNRYGHTYMVV
jgi:hypothetical protein